MSAIKTVTAFCDVAPGESVKIQGLRHGDIVTLVLTIGHDEYELELAAETFAELAAFVVSEPELAAINAARRV